MNPTELKMQDTIHLQSKPGYFSRPYLGLLCKCVVGCILNSVGLIINRETPCKYICYLQCQLFTICTKNFQNPNLKDESRHDMQS
jgi:hypothetical protein